jgi:hypothetical protein
MTAPEPRPSREGSEPEARAGTAPARRRRLGRGVVAAAAVIAQVALLFFYWFAPAMIAGAPWTYAFALAWWIELFATLVLAVRRPLLAPLVPVVSLVLGMLALRLGELYLGFTG